MDKRPRNKVSEVIYRQLHVKIASVSLLLTLLRHLNSDCRHSFSNCILFHREEYLTLPPNPPGGGAHKLEKENRADRNTT